MKPRGEILRATVEAEEALLGALLWEATFSATRDAINECAGILRPSDFIGYYPNTQPHLQIQRARIYQAMLTCELPPHSINVAETMNSLSTLQPGDCAYLYHLIASCPCALDFKDYAKTISHYSKIRNTGDTGITTQHKAHRKGLGY